jgi:ligand-binding sensor domain-containing protein
MKRLFFYCYYLSIILLPLYGVSQQNYNYRIYNNDEVIVGKQNNSILQDSKGFIWFSTYQGAVRFDGKLFKKFGRKEGLKNLMVTDFAEDKNHNIWIATFSGVYIYDGINIKSCKYTFDTTRRIFSAFSCTKEGKIIVSAAEKVLIQEGKDSLVQYQPANILYQKAGVKLIFALTDFGEYKYATVPEGMFVFNDKGFFQKLLPSNRFRPIAVNNSVWYTTNEKKTYRINAANVVEIEGLKGKEVYTIQSMKNGCVFVMSNKAFILKNDKIIDSVDSYDKVNRINGGFIDQEDNVWFYNANLQMAFKSPIKQFYHDELLSDLQKIQFATPISYGVSKNQLLVVGSNNAVFTNGEKSTNNPQLFAALKKVGISTLSGVIAKDGEVWIASQMNGLWVYKNEKLTEFKWLPSVVNNRINAIYLDSKNQIWLATPYGVLCIEKNNKTRYYDGRWFYSITETLSGEILATGVRGLYQLMKDSIVPIKIKGIEKESICFLKKGVGNSIWLNTLNDGIYHLKDVNGKIILFRKMHEKESEIDEESFHSIEIDSLNNIWAIGSKAVYYFDEYGKTIDKFNIDELGEDFSFTKSSIIIDASNKIWLNEKEKISSILYPHQPTLNTTPSNKVIITNVLINGNQGKLFKEIYGNDTLTIPLDYNQNNITFKFKYPNFKYPNAVEYQYYLEGAEKNWETSTKNLAATFNFLNPGNYTYKVRARVNGGDWTEPSTFTFHINAPWYFSWWSISIYVLFIIMFLIVLLRYQLEKIKKKNEIERKSIEYELRALRSDLDPHFIQNTFDLLAKNLVLYNSDKAIDFIRQISFYFRKLFYKNNHSVHSLEDELEFIENYLQLQMQMSAISFNYEFDIDEKTDLFAITVPVLFLQPFFENSIKYGINNGSEPGKIMLSIKPTDEGIIITLSDFGIFSKNNTLSGDEILKNSISLGMQVKRLNLIYATQKQKPTIKAYFNEEIGRGFVVIFELPIQD